MKLAEALILRADSQRRVEQLKQRLLRSAKVQEGDEPAEQPSALLAELETVSRDLVRLIQQINATNAATPLDQGMTMSDAIAARDALRQRQGIYRDLAAAATITQDRYSKSEVRFRSTVDVAEIQRTADRLAREHRELDAKIQEANWRIDLRE
jgi:hypothetical protein